ncbi:MAG TPA: hypothetical protein VF054_06790 [Micromonosporaceae bacterium]
MSAKLWSRGGLFEVDGITRHPHMTLYMARFPAGNETEICKRLAVLVGELQPAKAMQTGFFLTPGGYYEVSYARGDDLMALHLKVMGALHDLRYAPGHPVVEDYFAPYTPAQRTSAARWGYDLGGALYRPHITVSRFGGPAPRDLPVADEDLSFVVDRIGVFHADNMGAITTEISTLTVGR